MTRPHRATATALLAVAGITLGLAGCTSTTAGRGTPAAEVTAGAGAPTGSGGAGGTGTPAPAPATAGPGTVVAFGAVRLPVPAGARARIDGELLCLTLQADSGCSLEVLDVGRLRAAGGSVSTPAPGAQAGWWWGSDVPTCGDAGNTSPVTGSVVVEKGFRKVGPKTAAYGSWRVSCQNSDLDFEPRLWWLPRSQIAFRERSTAAGAGPAVDTVLAGVTFTG